MTEKELPGNPRLPVLQMLKDGFGFVVLNIGWLVRATALMALVIVSAQTVGDWLVANDKSWGNFIYLLMVPAYLLFAVTCHRIVILGFGSVPRHGEFVPGMREVRFFGWGLVMYLLAWLISIPVMMLVVPLSALFVSSVDSDWVAIAVVAPAMLVPLYLVSRWIVLLPATAVDRRKGLGWAWSITRENGLRILGLFFLLPLIWQWPLSMLLGHSPALDFLSYLVTTAFVGVEVILLSCSYRWLSEHVEPGLVYDGKVQRDDVQGAQG